MAYYTDKQLAKVIHDHGINETDAARGKPAARRYNPTKSVRPQRRTKEMERKQARKEREELYKAKDEMWAKADARANRKPKPKTKVKAKKHTTVTKRVTKPIQMKTVNNRKGR